MKHAIKIFISERSQDILKKDGSFGAMPGFTEKKVEDISDNSIKTMVREVYNNDVKFKNTDGLFFWVQNSDNKEICKGGINTNGEIYINDPL